MAAEPRRIGPSSEGPVDLALLKAHLRLPPEWVEEDERLEFCLDAATDFVETATSRALRSSVWELVLDGFPSDVLVLPVGPVSALNQITYRMAGDIVAEIDLDAVRVDLSRFEARVVAKEGWPTPERGIASVAVRWTVDEEACPPKLRQAILFLAGTWYKYPFVLSDGSSQELPFSVKSLIAAERRFL